MRELRWEGHGTTERLLNSVPLPLRIKSPAGVGTVFSARQAFPPWARGAVQESLPGLVRQPLTGSSPTPREERNSHGFRVRPEETAADALHAQTGATPAQEGSRRRASGAAVRHSPQRSARARLDLAAARAQNRSGEQDQRHRASPRAGNGGGSTPSGRLSRRSQPSGRAGA